MEFENNQDIKSIQVIFQDEGRMFELKHAIVQGVENKEDGKLLSLICNYTDISDFMMTYANFLIECYRFLEDNYEGQEDVEVLKNLKDYTINIFDGIEKGDFDNSEEGKETETF